MQATSGPAGRQLAQEKGGWPTLPGARGFIATGSGPTGFELRRVETSFGSLNFQGRRPGQCELGLKNDRWLNIIDRRVGASPDLTRGSDSGFGLLHFRREASTSRDWAMLGSRARMNQSRRGRALMVKLFGTLLLIDAP